MNRTYTAPGAQATIAAYYLCLPPQFCIECGLPWIKERDLHIARLMDAPVSNLCVYCAYDRQH